MSEEIINSKNNQKIKSYCDTCVCDSCEKLEAYQLSENEAKEIIAELEHENKKLKEITNEAKIEYENLLINRNDFAERAEKLEQENEELKNRLKTLDDEEFVYEVTEIEYNNFKKMNTYKQTLEEIREELKSLNSYDIVQNIQTKIDEVLGEVKNV